MTLDVDPIEAVKRMNSDTVDFKKRKETDNFRQLDFVKNLRGYFLQIPKLLPSENIYLIDANKSREEVFAKIRPLIDEVLF